MKLHNVSLLTIILLSLNGCTSTPEATIPPVDIPEQCDINCLQNVSVKLLRQINIESESSYTYYMELQRDKAALERVQELISVLNGNPPKQEQQPITCKTSKTLAGSETTCK